jgi:hypothetical protein
VSYPLNTPYRKTFNGERSCDAPGDFLLDLVGGGLDATALDSTTWGAADGDGYCGTWSAKYGVEVAYRPMWHAWFRGTGTGPPLPATTIGCVLLLLLLLLFGCCLFLWLSWSVWLLWWLRWL